MNGSLTEVLRRLDDPSFLHLSSSFQEALARLHFAVEHRLPLVAITGSAGAGRTTLLRRFRRELNSTHACKVHFSLAGQTESDIQTELAIQLGLGRSSGALRIAE